MDIYLLLMLPKANDFLIFNFFFENDKVQGIHLAMTKTLNRADFNNFVFYVSFYLLKNLLF
jgi:hypothetical protein